MLRHIALTFASLSAGIALVASQLGAQRADTALAQRSGRRVPFALDREIALARSAAPASISRDARVMMLTDSGFAVVADGSNGVTCVVGRSWNRSIEPVCYDPEGSATIMRIHMRRDLLRHRGKSEAEIDGEIGTALLEGKLRLPARPALSYMMSAGQVLYNDAGRYAGKWRPHLMIYYPYLTNASMALPARPEMSIGMVAEEGQHDSFLMIIMPTFIDVAGSPKP